MYDFSIGVMLDSFRTDTRSALKQAVEVGAEGIQIYATSGEMSPEYLSPFRCREFLNMVKSYGLAISALCGDLGQGFGDPQKNSGLIERSRRILELAAHLETDIVTTHIGVIPSDPAHDRYQIMQEACMQLCHYADELNVNFAIETGPETAVTLKKFLDTLDSKGVAVNFDPANLVMVTGDDPVQAVYTLKDYIVHTHAKDGRRLRTVNPEVIYGIVKGVGVDEEPAFEELALGQGSVDFPNYLRALKDIGYRGFLTVEREVGDYPAEDIRQAVIYLKDLVR